MPAALPGKKSLLILFAVASLWAEEGQGPRLGGFVGLQGGFPLSYGAMAELDYRDAYALRLEYYRYSEFQGLFPRDESFPYEDYLSRGIGIGGFRRFGLFKVGACIGAHYVTGTVRGNFLRSDSTSSWDFGGNSKPYGLDKYYEEVHLDGVLFPLEVSVGLAWKRVEIDFSPRFYYYRGNVFLNLPLGFGIGWP
jgi:hypothetical protein